MNERSAGCRRCGAPLTGGVPGGLCAACFGGGLFAEEPAVLPVSRIGDYELLEEAGRGGMGVVYRARQISLNRPAAVKLILTGPLASAAERRRFVAEASAAAALEHPGIVAVYDAGEEDGQAFYAMQFIEGESLWARLTRGARLNARDAAALIRDTALAVQHAHERGFLHRDLKPANLLLDSQGAPHIADFGLARRVDDDSHLTLTGTTLGTPAYMAPEQMDTSEPPTTAVDIYSLGAILYELLSGRPPFQAQSLAELFVAIREKPAQPVSAAGRDLDVICRKCLEKQPARRYRSARELAEDLQRWLDREPVRARPVSAAERLVRWCRRRPAVAALAASVVVLFIAGLAGVLWQWRRADREARTAREASAEAVANARNARRALYAADMNLCQAALRNNNLGRARRLLDAHRPAPGTEDLRGWEWRYLWAQCRSDALQRLPAAQREIRGLALSGDGNTAITNDDDGRLCMYDLTGNAEPRECRQGYHGGALSVSPDGRTFLCPVTSSFCEIWDFSGKVLRKLTINGDLRASAFSPDGALAAVQCSNGTIRIFDSAAAELKKEISRPETRFGHGGGLAFIPGRPLRLAAGTSAGLEIINCEDWTRSLLTGVEPGNHVSSIAVSPDGRHVAAGSCYADESVRVWETAGGTLVATLDAHTSWIAALLFSPDGATLYAGSADQTILLWNTADWTAAGELRGHSDELRALSMREGVLLSTAKNGEVLRWPAGVSGSAAGRMEFPPGTVSVLDSVATGGLLAVRPGFVRHWQPSGWQQGKEYALPGGHMHMSSGGLLAIRKPDGPVLLMDGSAEPLAVLAELEMPPYTQMICDSHRKWAVFTHGKGSFTLFERSSGKARQIDAGAPVRSLAFDGTTGEIVVWTSEKSIQDYHLRRYDPAAGTWKTPEPIPGLSGANRTDDQLRWMSHVAGTRVTLTRLSPFERVFSFDQEHGPASLRFSSGSNWLAVANDSAVARLWRLPITGAPGPPLVLQGHLNSIHSLAFTPDESRLVTLCSNREAAKFWDTETGVEMLTLGGNASLLMYARFTADGSTLLASRPEEGRTWQAWHAPSLADIAAAEKDGRWQEIP